MTPASPLELLLPRGRAERVLVIGASSAGALLPAGATPSDRAVDLVLLLPQRRELRRRGWLSRATAHAASAIAPYGAVYAVVPRGYRRRVRTLLQREGLHVEPSLAHLPAERPRYLVPLDPLVWRYAFGRLISSRPLVRLVLRALSKPLLELLLARVGVLARRADAPPPTDWVRRLVGGELRSGPAIVGTSWRGAHGSSTVHCFASREPAPWALAKVQSGESHEAAVLAKLGPAAAAAGARVPRPLAGTSEKGVSIVVETVVPGRVAARILARSPECLPRITGSIADWLAEWNRSSASPTVLDAAFFEKHVFSPAASLPSHWPNRPRYVESLRELCGGLEGHEAPLVAAHNDLTMWNVVLDDDERLGILDWETAEEAALPLVDFFYALVDAVAASMRYASRRRALEACFASGGQRVLLAAQLRERVAAGSGADESLVELAYHTCWLRHARNELAGGASAGEFVELVRLLATGTGVRAR